MTWQTMYPATPGSPYTTLASGIDDDDTSISLTADPGFAAATNLACIWDDAGNFEVVKYTDLTGTTLTVERAFEGTAQSWSAGAFIANLIPAYTINSLQNNIDDLNTNKASSTSAALSILVYDGTPSAGDLTTYDEIYTTPALCFAALPAIINHAVTITMRKADGSTYAAATLQRVVAGGSITIQGEYYYNNTVASAGSGTGKFNVIAAHSDLIQAGDKILLMKYSGTVGASTPSDAFVDTVAGVSGTEITLTDNTSIAFDTTWTYSIVRTECVSITVNQSNNVTVRGLFINTSDANGLYFSNCALPRAYNLIVQASGPNGIRIADCISDTAVQFWDSIAIKNTSTTANRRCVSTSDSAALFRKSLFEGTSSTTATYGGICNLTRGGILIQYSIIRDYGTGTGYGVVVPNGGFVRLTNCLLDGVSESYKMEIALQAVNGAKINCTSVTFGSYITTQKTPANWAATTDGSYIS